MLADALAIDPAGGGNALHHIPTADRVAAAKRQDQRCRLIFSSLARSQTRLRCEAYECLAEAVLAHRGGRYLARTGETVALEGDWQANRVAVLEFPSLDLGCARFTARVNDATAADARLGRKMIGVAGVGPEKG